MSEVINLNDSSPAAPTGGLNVKWQKGATTGTDPESGYPIYPVSAYYDDATGGGVNLQTDNYTAVAADDGKLISVNAAGNSTTVLLLNPPPSTTWKCFIENVGTGVLTVSPNGLQIDDADPALTLNQDQGVYVTTDGTDYFTCRGMGSGGGSSLALEVNGTPNGSQTLLNLVAGSGVYVSDDGAGDVTIGIGSAPVAVEFVQGASSDAANVNSSTCTFVSPNTAGNCIVVDVIMAENPANILQPTITDSLGNTYLPAYWSAQSNIVAATYYAPNCAAGTNTVTANSGDSSSITYITMAIHEYSGVLDVAAFDAVGNAIPVIGTPTAVSVTTTAADDLLHLFACGSRGGTGSQSLTESGGWAARESDFPSSGNSLVTFDSNAGAAGSYSDSVTATGAFSYMFAYLLALKTGSSGSGATLSPYHEIPAGAIDGSNQTYTLSRVPAANTLVYRRNGVGQGDLNSPPDFTLSGFTITAATPLKPASGSVTADWHDVFYWA